MKYFWLILTVTAVLWYIFVTAYVSYKGIADIKALLKSLVDKNRSSDNDL
ncbi:MAG: hypothetical protein ABIR33_12085 [Pyrinomonadaceae bacterium]